MVIVSRVLGKTGQPVEQTADFLCTRATLGSNISSNLQQYVDNVVGRGVDTTLSNDYIYTTGSTLANAFFYYDFSSIPQNAQDISVSIRIKYYSEDNEQYVKAAVNTAEIGSAVYLKYIEGEDSSIVSVNIPSITRANLLDLNIKVFVGQALIIYGMTATVTYKASK